jgi:cellulose synthase/poly-beta-1,6-N-acetylglucosamine synthase-like glycosyltransferase
MMNVITKVKSQKIAFKTIKCNLNLHISRIAIANSLLFLWTRLVGVGYRVAVCKSKQWGCFLEFLFRSSYVFLAIVLSALMFKFSLPFLFGNAMPHDYIKQNASMSSS